MESESGTSTTKTILDHIKVNVDSDIEKDMQFHVSMETTAGKDQDEQHCNIPDSATQMTEKHDENFSEKHTVVKKDIECTILDILDDQSVSQCTENKLLISDKSVAMEIDGSPDQTISQSIGTKPNKTMEINNMEVSNENKVIFSKDDFECKETTDKESEVEKNDLQNNKSSRSILDVCDTQMVPECSSVDNEQVCCQHFKSNPDSVEKTILDHKNYIHNIKCSNENVTGKNWEIFLCSEKTADNQPCNENVSSFVGSDLIPSETDFSSVENRQFFGQILSACEEKEQVKDKQNFEPVGSGDISSKQNQTTDGSNNVNSDPVSIVESGQNCHKAKIEVDVPMEIDCDKITHDLCAPDRLNIGNKITTDDKNLDKNCVNNITNERSKPDVYDLDLDTDNDATPNLSLRTQRKDQKQKENKPFSKNSIDNHSNVHEGHSPSDQNLQTVKTNNENSDSVPKTSYRTEKESLSTDFTDNKEKCRFKVAYIYNKDLVHICDQMEKIPNRASMVHSLINSYGMTRYMSIVEPRKASDDEVKAFHDPEYLEFLKKISNHDDVEQIETDATQYGLTYDCPVHSGLYDYATMTAGATLVAVECLIEESCKVAINWCGGWHHAARDQASGFCYINDIVLGILKLKEKYSKILYVDLDLHHGDGVEDAFSVTSKVMTLSFHKYAPGFFPGTGRLEDIGIGKGQYYTVNVPLRDGIRDIEFTPLVCRILKKIKETFQPEAVVCQCGADGLAGDPMESFNLTHKGLGKCVYFLLQWNIPTLLLGGGGYNFSNTARCWSFLTALAAGKQIPVEIPDHQYLMEYGPDYELDVQPGNRKNHNTPEYLRHVYGTVMNNISKAT